MHQSFKQSNKSKYRILLFKNIGFLIKNSDQTSITSCYVGTAIMNTIKACTGTNNFCGVINFPLWYTCL